MWRLHTAKRRLGEAWEILRFGHTESFDEFEQVNQVMNTEGVTDRTEAREIVSERLWSLWCENYPSEYTYWDVAQRYAEETTPTVETTESDESNESIDARMNDLVAKRFGIKLEDNG